MQHSKIADASSVLVERIKATASAKAAHDVAADTLRTAQEILASAHAAEVEAHAALHAAMAERKKVRRFL